MRGRILRVRPGHLSNFSGGAGYAGLICFISVPIAWLLTIIASITLYLASRRGQLTRYGDLTYYSDADGYQAPVGAWRLARRYLITLIVVAVVGIIGLLVCLQAPINVYSKGYAYHLDALKVLVLAAGPFFAAGITFGFQYFLCRRRGGRWWHLIVSPFFFLVLTLLLFISAEVLL